MLNVSQYLQREASPVVLLYLPVKDQLHAVPLFGAVYFEQARRMLRVYGYFSSARTESGSPGSIDLEAGRFCKNSPSEIVCVNPSGKVSQATFW